MNGEMVDIARSYLGEHRDRRLPPEVEAASSQLSAKLMELVLPPGFHWHFTSETRCEGDKTLLTVTATPRRTVRFED